MVDPAEKKTSRTVVILICLLLIVTLAAGAAYLFRAPTPVSGVERAAAQIARVCAGGNQLKNESEVAAGLTDQLTKLSGKSNVTSSDVGTLTGAIAQNDMGLKFYESYKACLKEQTENWLKMNGVKVDQTPAVRTDGETSEAGSSTARGSTVANGGIAVGGNVQNSSLSVNATDH